MIASEDGMGLGELLTFLNIASIYSIYPSRVHRSFLTIGGRKRTITYAVHITIT